MMGAGGMMEEPPSTESLRNDLLAVLNEQTRFNFRLVTALIALNGGKKVPEEAIDQLVSGVGEMFGRQLRVLRALQERGNEH
jgi:UDP:flavonoid glycosyltransferase YjiC (YdhE family)